MRATAWWSRPMTFIEHIWSQDPPYDLKGEFWNVAIKDAIMPELGVGFMPKPYQQPRAADLDLAREPELVLGARSPRDAAGASSRPTSSRPIRSPSHWAVYSKACAELGIPARGENWRVARNVHGGALRAGGARPRVRRRRARTAISSPISATCSSRVNILAILKPRPDMPDERGHAGGDPEGMRDLRLAEDRARQAGRLPRAGRPVRDAADDRPRLGRRRTKPGSASPCGCWRRR